MTETAPLRRVVYRHTLTPGGGRRFIRRFELLECGHVQAEDNRNPERRTHRCHECAGVLPTWGHHYLPLLMTFRETCRRLDKVVAPMALSDIDLMVLSTYE